MFLMINDVMLGDSVVLCIRRRH